MARIAPAAKASMATVHTITTCDAGCIAVRCQDARRQNQGSGKAARPPSTWCESPAGRVNPATPSGLSYHKYNEKVHIQLREFRRPDFDELWRIDQECFAPGISYSRMELDHYVRRRRAFTLIAESVAEKRRKLRAGSDAGTAPTIVGFIVVEQDTRGVGHVITIDVRGSARRAGVGSQLMDAAEERLRVGGCRAVFLETAVNNVSALSFYKRRGYSVLKTIPRYYQNNLDALLLGKKLEGAGAGSR